MFAWLTWDLPGWMAMCALAATLFGAIKLATLRGYARNASCGRLAGYLFAWVGLDARAFFGPAEAAAPRRREWGFAIAKTVLGIALALWAIRARLGYAATCMGLVGLLLAFHFGALHLLSCMWRANGVMARPIMRAPIAATSLASLWGERWNLAFADAARRFLLKPLARPLGAHGAGLAVFFFSGLVHEIVISVPARGGWGLPTLYFVLNGLGVVVEKSALGR
ncbi:MAG TPA: MBOAT family protein, partial [Opitutaceae bacterium]